MNGVVIVDKPQGCTSHDVVRGVRKAVNQKSVGHAGTLDPLATGVLVVAIGEATKLVQHLQAHDKTYKATIRLGVETDSLDADGEVTARAPVPELDAPRIEDALTSFLGLRPQQVPAMSAVKVDGKPLHRRVRRGERVNPPTKDVTLHEANVDAVSGDEIQLTIRCSKGFYVRSLARDLAEALGTKGHLTALRRTVSGPFTVEQSVDGDALSKEAIVDRLIPLNEACGALLQVELTDSGVDNARHGRPIRADELVGANWREAGAEEAMALMTAEGDLVALGKKTDDGVRVVRGFAMPSSVVVGH